MLKALETINTTKRRLKIEIGADAIEKEIRDTLDKLKRKTRIPGFRPGKAPLDLIEKRFGKEVEAEVLERLIPQSYVDALKEANITPIDNPVVEEKRDFRRHEPLSITLTVEVLPQIDNLRYENIKLKDIPVTVDDADVESVLKRQQEEKATYEPSAGPISADDLLIIDYSVPEQGVEAKDQVVKMGSPLFPEELYREATGKSKGDAFSVEMTFPEQHPLEKLAGKRVAVNVQIKDIKKVQLPPLDDELAKDIGFENLSVLKQHIREEIEKAKKNEVSKIHKAEILKELLESHEFDLPESLVENEVAMITSGQMANRREEQDSGEEDAEALSQETRQQAYRNVKASLLIQTIGKAESVSVSDEEVKRAILTLSQRLSVSPENLMKFYVSRDGSLDGLRNAIFEDKVLDLIRSRAAIEKGE